MYPACLSDVCEDGNYFLKLTRAQLKSNLVALDLSGSTLYRYRHKKLNGICCKGFFHKGRQSFLGKLENFKTLPEF